MAYGEVVSPLSILTQERRQHCVPESLREISQKGFRKGGREANVWLLGGGIS